MIRQLVAALVIGLWAMPLAAQQTPFPFAIGGPYSLQSSDGTTRTEADPAGRYQLLFFGYTFCPGMCPTVLPTMADVVDRLAAQGMTVVPLMITVDPARDTLPTLAEALAVFHPDFVGLTGDPAALQTAYDAFSIDAEPLFEDAVAGNIFAHQSHLFLLDPQGAVVSIIPPVLPVDRIAAIVAGYVGNAYQPTGDPDQGVAASVTKTGGEDG